MSNRTTSPSRVVHHSPTPERHAVALPAGAAGSVLPPPSPAHTSSPSIFEHAIPGQPTETFRVEEAIRSEADVDHVANAHQINRVSLLTAWQKTQFSATSAKAAGGFIGLGTVLGATGGGFQAIPDQTAHAIGWFCIAVGTIFYLIPVSGVCHIARKVRATRAELQQHGRGYGSSS